MKILIQFSGGRTEVAPNPQMNKFFVRNENENHKVGTGFHVHKRIISAVKRLNLLVIGNCT
jgi:hypothetical protein